MPASVPERPENCGHQWSPADATNGLHARSLLFARINGLPIEAAPDFAAEGEAYFRAETARCAAIPHAPS
jgi:hypothetical protein